VSNLCLQKLHGSNKDRDLQISSDGIGHGYISITKNGEQNAVGAQRREAVILSSRFHKGFLYSRKVLRF
jgi:hypothetical protein